MPMPRVPAAVPKAVSRSLSLAALRESKGIQLEQIAQATRISLRFLRAIEDEEFEKLPGGIFATSYIRQYAAGVDFDPTELLELYARRMNPEGPAATDPAPEPPPRFVRWLRPAPR